MIPREQAIWRFDEATSKWVRAKGKQVVCRCGKPSDNWPAEDGRSDLCLECWERQCSEEFWRYFG